jgi:hypothetical protein
MSGYGYDYSLTPARSGWRSALTGFLTIVAVVAVSTISGAVVTLELIAPQRAAKVDTKVTDTNVTASVAQPTVKQTIQTPAPQAAQVAIAAPSVTPPATPSRAAATTAAASTTTASADVVASVQNQPSRAPAPAPSPAQSTATIVANTAPASAVPAAAVAPERTVVSDSELTFSKGYARRHAAAAKATAGNSRLAEVGVAAGEFGRTAVKVVARAKPNPQAVASQDPRLDPRRPVASWSANRFDFDRHQALAFGESSRQQHRAPSGPLGGFFDRLF